MSTQPRTIRVHECGAIAAICPNGLSPAMECLANSWTCPCGYAEGLSPAHFPVPSIEFDNAIAMPTERVSFVTKAFLLHCVRG